MRSYSPVIENVAYTNALVRVFQNGQKVYERTVPAGPFKITDLTSNSSGNLTLEVIENGMKGSLADYEIASLSETNVLDVFPYKAE